MTTHKTLQLSLIKDMDEDGKRIKCRFPSGPIQCQKLILDSYSIISTSPSVDLDSQVAFRSHAIDDILLKIDWLENGYSCGTVTRGYYGPDTLQFVDNSLHLTNPWKNAGLVQRTGGLEMQTKNGVIPADFNVKMFKYNGFSFGDHSPGYTKAEADTAAQAFDDNGGPSSDSVIASQQSQGLINAFTTIHKRRTPYTNVWGAQDHQRRTIRVVLNFTLII